MQERKNEKEETRNTNTRKKVLRLTKYVLMIGVSTFWGISAFLAIKELWIGNGFFTSPWPLVSIVMTLFMIAIVLIPLFLELQADIKKIKEKKKKV